MDGHTNGQARTENDRKTPANGESEYFSESSAFYEREVFPPSAIRTANFSAEKFSAEKFFGRIFFGRKIFARFFSWGGLGVRSRPNHFKKFAKANFLKWCRGGVWGGLPPQETPLAVPCPPGGVSGISVTHALPPQVDVRTGKNLKMSSKGRTDLKI